MDNSILKARVQARCIELAAAWKDEHYPHPEIRLWRYCHEHGWQIERNVNGRELIICRLEDDLPADNAQWWLAAKILDIL